MGVATLVPYRGRRVLASIFVAALAMLLSVAVSVPPAMADTLGGKPLPIDPVTKYGFDIFRYNTQNPNGAYPAPSSPWAPQPVNSSVNPNGVIASRPVASGNAPLTGKLFLPGEPLPSGAPSGTVVKVPSVLTSTLPRFSGTALLLRGLGASGFGMGGVTQTPSNWKEMALNQGIPQTCIDDIRNCASGDANKLFATENCGHTGNCKALGAKDDNGNPITSDTDWWKQNVTPYLNNLWAALTGQTDQNLPKSDLQQDTTFRGCEKKIQYIPGANNNGNLSISIVNATPRPTTVGSNQANWDGKCGGTNATAAPAVSPGQYKTICTDKTTGGIAGDYSQGSIGLDFRNTTPALNSNVVGLCGNLGPDKATLFAIMFYQDWTQAQMDGSSTSWGSLDFSMWVNPDPTVNLIDNTQATTTVDCTGANGQVFTYSSKVSKVGAFEAPNCPPGFEMTKSSVQNNIVGTTGVPRPGFGTTLDSSAIDPNAATKYPLCDQRNGPGCSLSVWVDGTVCRSTRLECVTWIDTVAKSPSRVECHWGTYVMPVSDCYGIAEGYKTQTGMVLDPKTGVWTSIDTFGNPSAPSPQPWNPTNPNPQIGQTPGTPAPAPGAVPGGAGSPTPTMGDAGGQSCFPTGWAALNPIQWVYQPVQCALKWAFVPDTTTMTTLQTNVQADIDHVGFKPVQTAVVGMFAPLASGGSGCQGPPITFAMDGQSQTIYPFNACTAPMSIAAGICNALFTLAFTVGGGLALLRAISQAFGYNFSFGRGAGGTDA